MAITRTTNRHKTRLSQAACRARPVLIYNRADKKLPIIPHPDRGVLQAIQTAKVTARLSVAEICKRLMHAEPFNRYRYECLLVDAGLIPVFIDGGLKIKLLNQGRFENKFPELQHAAALLEAFQGARVGAHWQPCESFALRLVHPR